MSHLRLSNGTREIDFILQKGRKIVAIEVKAKVALKKDDIAHLNWFKEKVKTEYDVTKVVIYMGKYAYIREDDIVVIPGNFIGC